MLIISPKTSTTSRRMLSEAEAQKLAAALIGASVSFYLEPEPDDQWLFFVNNEAGGTIDQLIHSFG